MLVDLVTASRKLTSFLRRVHAAGLDSRPPWRETVRRYESLWLPLLPKLINVKHQNSVAVPPLDVAWLWHCHRLAPRAYELCCVVRLGATSALDAPACAFEAAEEGELGSDLTATAWKEAYPGEPFFLPPGGDATPAEGCVIEGFDVVASCARQSTFLWQVSGRRFQQDDAFLADAPRQYLRFLDLMRRHPSAFLVPTYQIDLMWHTHILAGAAAYATETRALAGRFVNHDDTINDRSGPDTKLNVSFANTQRLWREAYGEEYAVTGGMYRGEPPAAYWLPEWSPEHHYHVDGAAIATPAPLHVPSPPEAASSPPVAAPDPFIPARAKSTTRRRNANPRKPGYIFGSGPHGTGYYAAGTTEADRLIVNRLHRQRGEAAVLRITLLLFGVPLSVFIPPLGLVAGYCIVENERQIERYNELLQGGPEARRKAAATRGVGSGGGGCVGGGCSGGGEMAVTSDGLRDGHKDDGGGCVMMGAQCVCDAAGCGGGGGGGGGGGACGGAACGAGGCGGGGCGGGRDDD